ncbi:MAG: hypothetical protein Q9225_007953 [Loekoesia sp. 1 TL-2023]
MYDPKKSNPPAPVQKRLNYTVSYGGGRFGGYGYLVKDSVSIGNAVAHSMTVGVATTLGPNFPQGNSDGIMGLGFQGTANSFGKLLKRVTPRRRFAHSETATVYRDSRIPAIQPRTFMEILVAQGGLDLPVFTTNFNPTAKGIVPTIEFGKIDRSKYSGELSTAPVKSGSWIVEDVIFEVNGFTALYNQSMLFDTGAASLMYADAPLTDFYYHHRNVPSATKSTDGHWIVDCDAALPDLSMRIGNGTVVVPGKLMNNGGPAEERNRCWGTLQTTKPGTIGNVAGPFFTSHFVVFNQDPAAPSISYASYA